MCGCVSAEPEAFAGLEPLKRQLERGSLARDELDDLRHRKSDEMAKKRL
jgi:hypothetical protein